MKNEPYVENALDEEERDLMKALEAPDHDTGKSLTPEFKAQMQAAARYTLNEGSEKISIRIGHTDLARVKARALREGISYQTLIKSLIHRAVSR